MTEVSKKNLELEKVKKINDQVIGQQTYLNLNKASKKPTDDKDKKEVPLFLTTWEDTKTGKILAYSLGIGAMGTTVHDISHLNMSRSEFMGRAESLINGASSDSLEEQFKQNFPSTKTYGSVHEYSDALEHQNEKALNLSPIPDSKYFELGNTLSPLDTKTLHNPIPSIDTNSDNLLAKKR